VDDREANQEQHLKRALSTPMLSLYGAGTIVGAGIYVLIGEVAGEAGYWTPVAFLVAALVASVTGAVYAELSSRHPGAGGPVAYSNAAFGLSWLAVGIGWAIVATGVVSSATILSGFVGYLGIFVDLPDWLVITVLALVLGGVAAAGVKESAWLMAITTTAGVVGLILVMVAGYGSGGSLGDTFGEAASITDMATVTAILAAAFLAFYAFIGFEDLVHMSEEAREPRKGLPRAIVIALAVSAVLYVLTAVAALLLVSPDELSGATAPLVTTVEAAGWPGWPLGILSLMVIVNGAMAQIIMATRVIYSLRKWGGAPDWLGRPHPRTGTPIFGTVVVTATLLGLAIAVPLKSLASITSFIMLAVFFISNLSLIVLERRKSDAPFDVPTWLPYLGAALCVGLAAAQLLLPGGGE